MLRRMLFSRRSSSWENEMATENLDSSSVDERWAELLQEWQEGGNLDARDKLLQVEIRVLKQRILARGKGIIGSPASASDVVNDAVVRILNAKQLPKFKDRRVFSAYLWTCAWRLLLMRLRKSAIWSKRRSSTTAHVMYLGPGARQWSRPAKAMSPRYNTNSWVGC